MLFHLSIEADNPQRVATVLAEIWGGVALPFPPVAVGSWMAFHGADNGTMIEVYPRGTELIETDADAVGAPGMQRRHNATHFAMSTDLPFERICEIGELVEILTHEMQAEYLDFVRIDSWSRMLAEPMPDKLAA
jgi:hypothetical protein